MSNEPIDLAQFCSTEVTRPALQQPWSRGDYTYATNGHIIVRVNRRQDVSKHKKAPETTNLFAAEPSEWFTVKWPDWPEFELVPCEKCEGIGNRHPCWDCACGKCDSCGGTGDNSNEFDFSVGLGDAVFALKYARILARFQNLVIAAPHVKKPLRFKFDGGDGVLMPRYDAAPHHFTGEIIPKAS